MRILVLGNSGLNNSNNSTNNRMKRIFELLNQKYGYTFDYYKLRKTTLEENYIRYINNNANSNPIYAIMQIFLNKVKYDLIIAETFNAAIVAYVISLFNKTSFIWRQFGTTFNDELNFKNYFKPKIFIKFLLYKIIANSNFCKAIVCTEDGCANRTLYLNKLKVKKDKFFMVKNQRTERLIQLEEKEKKDNKFYIIQVGRINPWKKIHLLLDTLINIKNKFPEISENIELNIIGQTQDINYENKLKDKIQENKLEKNIFFKKDLDYHQIEEIFQYTNLSISLTAYNPIIESLQNEIPVITYEYGEIGEVFNECKAVCILAKDIKKSSYLTNRDEAQIISELENKILELYNQKESLSLLGKEGKKFVENNFPTVDEHAEEIISIYMKEINAFQ